MKAKDVLDLVKEHEVKFVDLRFTDTVGKELHVTYPAQTIGEDDFEDGKMFDGSSISGWKGINGVRHDPPARPGVSSGRRFCR